MKGALLIAVMLATTVLVESFYNWEGHRSRVTGPRSDLRCGSKYNNAICDPHGESPCCSDWYWCGNTAAHCHCSGCVDYTGCQFPFKYEGKTYHSCTYDYGHGHPWCSLTANYEGKWKNCAKKRGEDQKKEVLQDAAAVLKEILHEAKKETVMDLLFAGLDGSVAVPQDPAAEWEKKEKEAEEEAEEEELEEELEELEEELKNKEGDE